MSWRYDDLQESKPRDLVLSELKENIRTKLVAKHASSNELYRLLNRKGDGSLDVYEFCFSMSQLLGQELVIDDIIDAYNLTAMKNPYYLSYEEFVEHVLNLGTTKYELNPAIDDDRLKYISKRTPQQDANSMNHRVLKNALRANRKYKYKNGTFNILDEGASTEEVMFHVIDCFNETHLKMRKIFKDIDLDKSGKLNKMELASGLKAVGLVLTGHQINSIMRLFDKDGSGQLSYSEFVRMLSFVSNHDDHRPRKIMSGEGSRGGNNNYGSKVSEQKPLKKYIEVSHRSAMRKNREKVQKLINTEHTLTADDYDLIKDISDSVYDRRKSVRKFFKAIDRDGSGTLSAAEAHRGFNETLGIQIHENHVDKLISVFDRNNDGLLNYSDFMNFLASSTTKINKMDSKKHYSRRK
jgi:Ca2+-binding EF-hand superfamily protein